MNARESLRLVVFLVGELTHLCRWPMQQYEGQTGTWVWCLTGDVFSSIQGEKQRNLALEFFLINFVRKNTSFRNLPIPVVPHKAVAEVSKIGNL